MLSLASRLVRRMSTAARLPNHHLTRPLSCPTNTIRTSRTANKACRQRRKVLPLDQAGDLDQRHRLSGTASETCISSIPARIPHEYTWYGAKPFGMLPQRMSGANSRAVRSLCTARGTSTRRITPSHVTICHVTLPPFPPSNSEQTSTRDLCLNVKLFFRGRMQEMKMDADEVFVVYTIPELSPPRTTVPSRLTASVRNCADSETRYGYQKCGAR